MKIGELKKRLETVRTVLDIKHMAMECANSEDLVLLISFMKDRDAHVSAMAAWCMGHVVIKNPDILSGHHQELFLEIASNTQSSSLKRNIMRAWQAAEIPGNIRFQVAELALAFLAAAKEDIAIKAFSITVLQHIVPYIPELKEEILFILERDMPHASAAYINRARQFMKATSSSR
jgi:hypothetical protein